MQRHLYMPPFLFGSELDGHVFPHARLLFATPGGGDAPSPHVYAAATGAARFTGAIAADAAGRLPHIWLDPAHRYEVTWLTPDGAPAAWHAWMPPQPHAADGGLFRNLHALTVPPMVSHLRSDGWANPGVGRGDYVSDALATPALAAAHPRFAAVTANGRCFRLAGTGGGITVEQGGALGDPQASGRINDQPAIQAALAYAEATGLARVAFGQASYSLWAPVRHSAPGGRETQNATDGQPLSVPGTQRVHLLGLLPQRSRLAYFSAGGHGYGGSLAQGGYQLVQGAVWRGSGLHIRNVPATGPGRPANMGAITLENLVLDGGTRRTATAHWPAFPATGEGWDVTHKGIYAVANNPSPDLTILNCELSGWRGESVYASNDKTSHLTIRDSAFRHAGGQGLNPNGCLADIENCAIDDCFLGIEGWTGIPGGRIVGVTVSNCGQGVRLSSGLPTPPTAALAAFPTTSPAALAHYGEIDITCVNSGDVLLGWWMRGRLTLIGTHLVLGEGIAYPNGSQYVDLEVVLTDTPTANAFVALDSGIRQPGSMRTNHVRLDVKMTNPPLAPGHNYPAAVWQGSLGDDIHLHVSAPGNRKAPGITPGGSLSDHAPHIG